jgi:6-phosphofructokinase 1
MVKTANKDKKSCIAPAGKKCKGTIGILTGGGDVPGLNPAIRSVTIRAIREGYRVIGIKRGWAGLVDVNPDIDDLSNCCELLSETLVNKVGRTGGTFLFSSRTNPTKVIKKHIPPHLKDKYTDDVNDVTDEVLKNLDYLGIDYLIPIGGDDTLSFGSRLHKEGVKVIGIPKTMDNDVPGTDYCIGFSTCVTRTIELTHALQTSAGSHERFLIIEVFGRYAGFTSLLPTMAGAANRCLIPEYPFDINRLTELLWEDRFINPSSYSVCLVSEGAKFQGEQNMIFEGTEADAFGHRKLGGIGDLVSSKVKELSSNYTKSGRRVGVINQRMGYLVRCGDPDAIDSIVPMAFGNLALNLIIDKKFGRLVSLRNGRYDNVPLDVVDSPAKVIDVEKYYNIERLRPIYTTFDSKPLFIMTSDY